MLTKFIINSRNIHQFQRNDGARHATIGKFAIPRTTINMANLRTKF